MSVYIVGQAYYPLLHYPLLHCVVVGQAILVLEQQPVASRPLWAKRLAWYMDYGVREECVPDGDLGWAVTNS